MKNNESNFTFNRFNLAFNLNVYQPEIMKPIAGLTRLNAIDSITSNQLNFHEHELVIVFKNRFVANADEVKKVLAVLKLFGLSVRYFNLNKTNHSLKLITSKPKHLLN